MKPPMSAWICIAWSLLVTPPSTLSLSNGISESARIASRIARVLLRDRRRAGRQHASDEKGCRGTYLEGDGFKCRSADVCSISVGRDANEEAACLRVPVRRKQAREGGDKVDAAGVFDGRDEIIDVGRLVNDLHLVAQPTKRRRWLSTVAQA